MSAPKILLWTVTALLASFGCDRYEAPCVVGEPELRLPLPAAGDARLELRSISGNRVLLLQIEAGSDLQIEGWAPSAQDVKVDSLIVEKDGAVSARHQVMRDVPPAAPSWSQPRARAWLGDSLAALSTPYDLSEDSQGNQHIAQQLQLSIHDEQGLRSGPIALAACTDCILNSTVRGIGDEALVVFAQQAWGQTDWQTSWVAMGSDGLVRASGSVGDLAADETVDLSWFGAPPREDALFIPTTGSRAWLVDSRFRRLTAPMAWQGGDEWDWDLAGARIARAWTVNSPPPRDILTEVQGFDGQALLAEDRISADGNPAAIAVAPGGVGLVLYRSQQGWFMARGSDGAKLGGDVAFDLPWAWSMLVPTGASSFRFYGVEQPDSDAFVFQSRTMECRP